MTNPDNIVGNKKCETPTCHRRIRKNSKESYCKDCIAKINSEFEEELAAIRNNKKLSSGDVIKLVTNILREKRRAENERLWKSSRNSFEDIGRIPVSIPMETWCEICKRNVPTIIWQSHCEANH